MVPHQGPEIPIPAFATSTRLHEVIESVIGEFVEIFGSWAEFEACTRCSPTAVIGFDEPEAAVYTERVVHLTRTGGRTQFILLIDDGAISDDLLGRLAVAKVIRVSRARRSLRAVVLDIASLPDLWRVVDRISGDGRVAPLIRQAVRIASTGPLPVPSINQLAETLGCSRRTLSREWRRSMGPDAPLDLDDMMGWISLLRALAIRTRHATWKEVAMVSRTSQAVLRRHASRLLNRSLRELDFEETMHRFMVGVVDPVLKRTVPK